LHNRPTQMKVLNRFWSGLEALPGLAGVQKDWRDVWEHDWEVGQAFLRPTDTLASTYPCPYPGGDGCPRGVIAGERGFVAVCRSVPRQCSDLPLTRDDIVAWELSWPKLGAAIASALGFSAPGRPTEVLHHTQRIAWHHLVGGKRAGVYLTIQYDETTFAATLSRLMSSMNLPLILAAPTASLCASDSVDLLARTGVLFLPLDECLMWDEAARFVATDRAKALLSDLAAVSPESKTWGRRKGAQRRVEPVDVPDGARWDEPHLVVDDHNLQYRLRGKTGHRGFAEAGFEDDREGNIPNSSWQLLREFAKHGGHPIELAHNREDRPAVKQRVSKLRGLLRELFPGVIGDPIINVGPGAYKPAFRISSKDGFTLSIAVGDAWLGVSVFETRDGRIRFVAEAEQRFVAYTDGHTTEFSEAAERAAENSQECDLQILGLVGEDGQLSAAGGVLLQALRSRGRVTREGDVAALIRLCDVLCRVTGIDESPFDLDGVRGEWVAKFEAGSERTSQ
jgi:hypothetical protein